MSTDAKTVLRDMSRRITALQGDMLQLSSTLQSLTANMTALSHSFQQIVLTIDEENAEVGCVEPWYEPCEEDPNICVHKRIDPELKAEVCREFAGTNYPKNKIINFPGRTDVRLGRSDRGPGRFKVTAENFPVAHTAGDTTHVPGSDPSEASIPVHQSGFLFETGESSKNAR